jgi:hypothetical protein
MWLLQIVLPRWREHLDREGVLQYAIAVRCIPGDDVAIMGCSDGSDAVHGQLEPALYAVAGLFVGARMGAHRLALFEGHERDHDVLSDRSDEEIDALERPLLPFSTPHNCRSNAP